MPRVELRLVGSARGHAGHALPLRAILVSPDVCYSQIVGAMARATQSMTLVFARILGIYK